MLFVPRCLVPSARRTIRTLLLRRHINTLDFSHFTNLSNDGGMGLQGHFGQTMGTAVRGPFIVPTQPPFTSSVRILEAEPLTSVGFLFDEASSMLFENMDSLSGGGTNLATVPIDNTSSNFQSSGIARMRGETERLSFIPLSPPELPEESIFSNSTEREFAEVGFDWGGQQSLFQGNELSSDYFEVYDALGSSSPTSDDNIAGFEELAPSSRGFALPFESLDFNLMDPSSPFMDLGDFNSELQPHFELLDKSPLTTAEDAPQSPELISSGISTPTQVHTLPAAPAPRRPSQRFHCPAIGCIKNYKREHELKRHQKAHAGTKPHRCSISGCNRSGQNGFARRDHLRQHARKVHGTTL